MLGVGALTDYTGARFEPTADLARLDKARGEGAHDEAQIRAKKKIALMLAQGVDDQEIAEVYNVPKEAVQEIQHSDEYKEAIAEQIQQGQTLNRGWDAIETLGIGQTIEYLKMGNDPLFALNAAKAANGMKRRNGTGEQINVERGENGIPRVVIQLNAEYAERLQNNFVIESEKQTRPKKIENSLDYSQAERALGEEKKTGEEEQETFFTPAKSPSAHTVEPKSSTGFFIPAA